MKDSPGVSQDPAWLAGCMQACCMVDLAGQTFTSATDLRRGLEAAASMNSTGGAGAQLFEFDHVM
ncbi:hypothetical protein HaLaN_17227, partial [Haematococcus lacustris]